MPTGPGPPAPKTTIKKISSVNPEETFIQIVHRGPHSTPQAITMGAHQDGTYLNSDQITENSQFPTNYDPDDPNDLSITSLSTVKKLNQTYTQRQQYYLETVHPTLNTQQTPDSTTAKKLDLSEDFVDRIHIKWEGTA